AALDATPRQFDAAGGGAGAARIVNPSDSGDVVGTILVTGPDQMERAIATATDAGLAWSRVSAAERAGCLERAADLLESERATFIALAVREAGKTFANAVSE